MAQIYFIDISTSADSITSGTGTEQSCYNYSQFRNSLAFNDETNVANYYYLKGNRNIITSGESLTPLSAENMWLLSKRNVYIESWNNDPWKINFENDFYLASYVDWFETINLKNGFIRSRPTYFKFSIDTNVSAAFQNCWLDTTLDDSNSEYSGGRVRFVNCTLNNFAINNKNFNFFTFINTIIENPTTNNNYIFNNTIFTTYHFDNVVSNRYILNQLSADRYNVLNPSIPYGLNVTYAIEQNTNPHEFWNSSAAEASIFLSAISALNQNNISYVDNNFINISAVGNNATIYNYTWWNGIRDGVGALYFPITIISLSANGQTISATASLPATVNFNWNNIFIDYGSSAATLDYNDTQTSSFNTNSATSSTYIYNYNIGNVFPTLSTESKNGWYNVTSGINIELTLTSSCSAVFNIWNSTSANITSANTDNIILYNFSGLSNGIYNYTFNYGNEISSVYQSTETITNIPLIQTTYPLSDKYNVQLWLNNLNMTSADLLIQRIYNTYYVNLDISYITSSGNGTESSAFSYEQFYDRIKTSGTGSYGDTYNLKNLREINISSVNNIFDIDKTKNYNINAWDISANGPWVLVLNNNYSWVDSSSATIASFAGSTLKNGIVYNKPYYKPPFGYLGSKIIFTNMYDVYVVQNGTIANFNIEPYNYVTSSTVIDSYVKDVQYTSAYSNIIGSTIYVPNTSAITDTFVSALYLDTSANGYTLNLIDSVLTNFISSAGTLSSCSATIRNCAFNINSSSATFMIITNVQSQFDWVPPTDINYPFNRSNVMYDKDMSYILVNKKMLKPFSLISNPPNPGYGYPTYNNYETGLFGYNRSTYKR